MNKLKTENLKELYLKTLYDKHGNLLQPKTEQLATVFDKNGKPASIFPIVSFVPQKPKTMKTLRKHWQ